MSEPLVEPMRTFTGTEPAGDDSDAPLLEPGTLEPLDDADEDA